MRLAAAARRESAWIYAYGYAQRWTSDSKTERLRLKDTARKLKFPLRSQSFALAYYGHGPSLGFISIARPGYSSAEPPAPRCTTPSINLRDLTSGQLYFVLENRHGILKEHDDDRFIDELTRVVQERFEREPYHVQRIMFSLRMLFSVAFGAARPMRSWRG